MSSDMLKEVKDNYGGDENNPISEFVKFVIGLYTDHPDELEVQIYRKYNKTDIHCWPHRDDYGKICGRRGIMLQALIVIVKAFGSQMGEKLEVFLEGERADPFNPIPPIYTESPHDPKWNKEMLRPAIEGILTKCGMENLQVLIKDRRDKEGSLFTVARWKEDQKEFAAALIFILRATAKKQGHELIHDDSLAKGAKK